jgi:hypothetical protein
MGKAVITTQTISNPADQRAQVESLAEGSQFVAGGATVANPGAVAGTVGSYSTLNQDYKYTTSVQGLTSDQVRQMLLDQQLSGQESVKQVTQLSSAALKSSEAALNTLAATKVEEPTDWTRYIPYGVVAVIVLAMMRRRAT